MNTYYEVLGLEPDTSQAEIKKAYFKLVRQHSPESDPEQFQKIREAYEQLKKSQAVPQGPSFAPFSEPLAAQMMERIRQYRTEKNGEKIRDACEEAWRRFPDDIQFLYLLVIAQRSCGNTGKAVKNAELLVSKDLQNKWFHKELAISYMERGFTKKAFTACQKAYELGCRDLDFVLMFAGECDSYGQFDRGVQILLEIVQRETRWTREDMPELSEAFTGLLCMNYRAGESYLTEIMEQLRHFLEQYHVYMKEYIPELAMVMSNTCVYPMQGAEEIQKTEQLFAYMDQLCGSEEGSMVKTAMDDYHYYRLMEDHRISDTVIRYLNIFRDIAEINSTYRKFALTDTQLCMLEEREEILRQAAVVRQEYPKEYELLAEFIQKLESSNLAYLKDSLLKTYSRLEPMYVGGFYYKKYPQEKKKMTGTLVNEGYEEEPYVRSAKKIGRNDPCPCGSGKKYKHCCMNK